MRNHVDRLLTAYVQGQLSPEKRQRVMVHVRLCAECRVKLEREQQLAYDMKRAMPQVGQPRRGQLARLWPRIWAEFRAPRSGIMGWLPSYGLVLTLILLGVFVVSSLFGGSAHAIAAPLQAIPAEVQATATAVRTDEPSVASLTPEASETAAVSRVVLMPSPAPKVIARMSVMGNR